MVKRWDTFRVAKWGVVFGIVYSVGRAFYEHGMPSSTEGIVYIVSYIFGGAVAGAGLFALVSGTRNLILRAK
jgi:hypothetical protein